MASLPPTIADLVACLRGMPGVVAVVLGGSRALDEADDASDWDLGVYYRGQLELSALAARGEVHPPGAWGRIMNGGAWLEVEGAKVDVLLRDLDFVERCAARARDGEFDVDALLGYTAGVPTYSVLAERAVAKTLAGELAPIGPFPPRLAEQAPPRWRFCRDFSVAHARARARRGDVVGAVGQVSKAVVEEAHARLCARRAWVLNEKRIVERAGLAGAHAWFARVPTEAAALVAWVDGVHAALAARDQK